jgi:hypothetical protein
VDIVQILANNAAVDKFRDHIVLGSQLPITELHATMTLESLREHLQKAQADESRPYVLVLRAREGTSLSILRMLGELYTR